MKKDLILYIDFDSTLYDTAAFARNIWQMVSSKTGMDIDRVKHDASSHYLHATLGGYDFDQHIRSYGLEPAVMWAKVCEIAEQKDFLYSDSAEFMHALLEAGYRPRILTYGEEQLQLVKIYPTLKYLMLDKGDVIVVNEEKNQYIARHHSGKKGVLVDDKPDQYLPEGFTELRIDRSHSDGIRRVLANTVCVSNLRQAYEVITGL